MKIKTIAAVLLSAASFFNASTALSQAVSPDLAVYYLLTPTNSAKQDQHVSFYPYNQGQKAVNTFEARVYKDGEFLFSEQVNQHLGPDQYELVELQNTVHLEYEEECNVSLRLVTPGDKVSDNDSTTMHVTMPKRMDYPFTWTSGNHRTYFHDSGLSSLDWQYSDDWGAYYMSGRSTNWFGTLITDALQFPEGEPVKCSFEYGTSGGDVTLYFTEDYGDNVTVIDTVYLTPSTIDFSPTYFTFRAKGAAMIRVNAELGGEWTAEGSIFVRNICFTRAEKDLVAQQILQPAGNACALGAGEIKVSARFSNPSLDDVTDPVFCYDTGWGEVVRETYHGTIAPGQSLDFTFGQTYQCSQPCSQQLSIWCEAEGDSDQSNNSLSKLLTYYEPLPFPYLTTFDDDNHLWLTVDVNNDGQTFTFEPMARDDMAATFVNYAAESLDEELISPAIRIPAGRHRVDFNYACFMQQGDVNLKLYMGKSPDVSTMTELLFEADLRSQLWSTGYHLLDIPTEGIYYFAFVAQGRKDAVVIDNFKVDDGEDLGITDLHFDVMSGYNLTTTTVTITYANYGISPQLDVTVGYAVNNGEYVEETNPTIVEPGESVTYTFATVADVSEVGTEYYLEGMILSDGGDEDINDFAYGGVIFNDAPQQIPYFNDFSDADRNDQWLLQSNHEEGFGGWEVTYLANSYSPLGALKHSSWESNRSDSWAYSEGIEMKKGRYEVSFFHHEAPWFDGPEYKQNFELRMGCERTPDGMTIAVDEQKNVDICNGHYAKIVHQVDIPADGIYYLGFHNTSRGTAGMTLIDDISIMPLTEGADLPYVTDFSDAADWTFYDPNDYNFLQWQVEPRALVANRTQDDMWTEPEGMAVSPHLHLKAGKTVNITVDYEVTANKNTLKLALYGGNVNNQSELHKLVELPRNETLYTYQFETGAEEQDFYLGLRSNTKTDGSVDYSNGPFYKLIIRSLSITYETDEAIGSLEADPMASYEVFDLAGSRLGQAQSIDALHDLGLHGIFLVRIISTRGTSVLKVRL